MTDDDYATPYKYTRWREARLTEHSGRPSIAPGHEWPERGALIYGRASPTDTSRRIGGGDGDERDRATRRDATSTGSGKAASARFARDERRYAANAAIEGVRAAAQCLRMASRPTLRRRVPYRPGRLRKNLETTLKHSHSHISIIWRHIPLTQVCNMCETACAICDQLTLPLVGVY